MESIRNLSLKFKLTFLLVLLTGSMLTLYGIIVLRDFEKDKIAYVLDSSRTHSFSAALQIKTEISHTVGRVKFLMQGYLPDTQKLTPESQTIIQQEKIIAFCLSWIFDKNKNEYELVELLKGDKVLEKDLEEVKKLAPQLRAAALKNEVAILRISGATRWALGLRFQDSTGQPMVVIVAINSGEFLSLFDSFQMYDSYLVDENSRQVIAPTDMTYQISSTEADQAFKAAVTAINSMAGVYEYTDNFSKIWLISAASVGFGGLKVMSLVPRSAALEAIYLIIVKSVLFLLFLLFITIFISILVSTSLTRTLQDLLGATREISKGHFAVNVDFKNGDEVGLLAKGFNQMALEIQRLVIEIIDKTRMESELKTAQLVQSTLFPKGSLIEKDLEIHGSYQSASECSGDWWHYQRVKNKTFFCVGDATGHGVPAALLTAAARSAIGMLEIFPNITLNEMIVIFNKAIYNTAHGQITMTFFLGTYDHATGVVDYINASHEPPFIIPQKSVLNSRDFIFLNENISPPLGRESEAVFESTQVQLNYGDRIFAYTDGLTELQNAEGTLLGERSLMKCITDTVNKGHDTPGIIKGVADKVADFAKDQPLNDDVTYFIVTRKSLS